MKLNSIKKKLAAFDHQHHYVLAFFVLLIFTLPVFAPYVTNLIGRYLHLIPSDTSNLFLIQSDYLLQYVPFYEEFFRLVESGSLGWSANEMFGIAFYASKAYYLVGDIFAWLMLGLHQFIGNTIDILFGVTILKLVLSGLSFDFLLKQLNIRSIIRLLYALLYMFGGWMTIFIEQPVFIGFYVFAPLLISSIFITIKQGHPPILLILSSALCISTQYYLCWMLCVLLLIFWCCYHVIHHTKFNSFIKLSLHTLFYFLVGVLISGVIWLPSLLHMFNNPRLGQNELNTYWTYDIKDVLNILKNSYAPVLKFADHSYRSYWYYFYQTGIYAGVFNNVVLPLFFMDKTISKTTRKTVGITLIILLLTFISPQIAKVFHFTYSLRYTYGIMLILLICGALWYNHDHRSSTRQIVINGLIQFVVCLLIGVVWPLSQGYTLSTPDVKICLVSSTLVLLYTVCLILSSNNHRKIIVHSLLVLLIAGETIFYSGYALKGQTENAQSYASYLYDKDAYTTTLKALKEFDPQFYRIQLVNSNLNDGLVYNIPTPTAYDSVYQYGLHDFLQWIRQYPDVNWSFNVDVPDLDPLLNVRYILLNNPTPTQMGYYKYWANEIDLNTLITILKIKEPTAFARTVSVIVSETLANDYLDETIPLNGLLSTMSTSILVEPKDVQTLTPYLSQQTILFNPNYFTDNEWSMKIDGLTHDSLVFIAQSYDPGWIFKDENGQTIESFSIDGGFTGLIVPQSTTSIHATYHINGFSYAMVLTITGIGLTIALCIYQRKRRFPDHVTA